MLGLRDFSKIITEKSTAGKGDETKRQNKMSKGDRIPRFLSVIDNVISKVDELANDYQIDCQFDTDTAKTHAYNLISNVFYEIAKKMNKNIEQLDDELGNQYSTCIANIKKSGFEKKNVLSTIDTTLEFVEKLADKNQIQRNLSFDFQPFRYYVETYVTSVFNAIIAKTHKKWEQVNEEFRLKIIGKHLS